MSIERPQATPENDPEKALKVFIQPVTFKDLVDVGVSHEQIDQLSDEDLTNITHDILLHFNHDVFPYELKWQVNELLNDRDNK